MLVQIEGASGGEKRVHFHLIDQLVPGGLYLGLTLAAIVVSINTINTE